MKISDYTLHRVHLELPRSIDDSQVCFTDHWMTILELSTDSGLKGVGFELQQGMPIAVAHSTVRIQCVAVFEG